MSYVSVSVFVVWSAYRHPIKPSQLLMLQSYDQSNRAKVCYWLTCRTAFMACFVTGFADFRM